MIKSIIIIGGGPAGYVAAIRASQLKLDVTLIEEGNLGGTCLNVGCIPTKYLLRAANEYKTFLTQAKHYQVETKDFDGEWIYNGVNELIERQTKGIKALLRANGINHLTGRASLVGCGVKLRGSDEILTADKIVVATGSKASLPSVFQCDDKRILTSDDVLRRPVEGKRVAIIGGGVIGVELANYLININKEVVIYEYAPSIISFAGKDLSMNLQSYLKTLGIKVVTNVEVQKIDINDSFLEVCTNNGGEAFDNVIVAIGRKGNIPDGLVANERGFLSVDENYLVRDNIYAIGDVNGISMLAHSASAQGINLINSFMDIKENKDTTLIPSCIYTDIEVAYVGANEEALKAQGAEPKVVKYMMGGNSKVAIEEVNRGFIKLVLVDDIVVGAQLFCLKASEMISYFTTVINNKLSYKELKATIFPHPSLSEGINEALEEVTSEAIHVLPRV